MPLPATLLVLLIDRPDRLGRAWPGDEPDVGAACARLRETVPDAPCVVMRTATDAPPLVADWQGRTGVATEVTSAFHTDAHRLGELGVADATYVLVARTGVVALSAAMLREAVTHARRDGLDLRTLDDIDDEVGYVVRGALVRDLLALGAIPGALTLPQAVRRLARAHPDAPLPWCIVDPAASAPASRGAGGEPPVAPARVVAWPTAARDVVVVLPSPYQTGAHFAWLAVLDHLDPARVAFVVACHTQLADALKQRGFVTMLVDAGWPRAQGDDATEWRQALAILRPKVLHMDGAEGAPLMAVARDGGARVLLHVRLLVVDRFLPACAEADVVVAVSAALRETLGARLGGGAPVVHVPDGVPVPAAIPSRAALEGRPLRCVCLGRVEPSKDQGRVIDIVRALASDGPCELRLVGPCGNDVAYADDVTVRLRALPAAVRASWLPFTHPVADQYAWADVVLVASRSEALGMVGLEALAQGCLLVAQRSAGYAEIVDEDAGTGLLFDRDDTPDEIAARIREALPSWTTYATRAHLAATTRFDARLCVTRLMRLWEERHASTT